MSATSAGAGDLGPGDVGPGPRTRIRRLPERARYDRATVEAILDEGFVCHLGFCSDGEPVVIPTAYARVGDVIYVHGPQPTGLYAAPWQATPSALP